jgi:hypothetical protein
LITGAVAAVLLAPFVLLLPLMGVRSAFAAQSTATGLNTGAIFQPWQVWWFLGSHGHILRGLNGNIKVGYRTPPGWVESIGHPLVIAIMVPLTALHALVRRRLTYRVLNAPLLLLALLLALRCVLDPWDVSYYSLPFLLTLLAWETLSFNRPPVLSLVAAFAAWLILERTATLDLSADMQALIFALVSIPSMVALSLALYAPGTLQRLISRFRRDAATRAAGWSYGRTQKAGAGT